MARWLRGSMRKWKKFWKKFRSYFCKIFSSEVLPRWNRFQSWPMIYGSLMPMRRLNSRNHGIFYPSVWILILNSSACRALKIIWNDIKNGTIPWDFKVEIPCFNFSVGENVGGMCSVKQTVKIWGNNNWRVDFLAVRGISW